jgi:ornithine carbamoyltransferase
LPAVATPTPSTTPGPRRETIESSRPTWPRLRAEDLLCIGDLSGDEIRSLLDLAALGKRDAALGRGALAGRSVILLFEKASLRTRVSFEVGATRLGAHAMYFDHSKERIGQRENVRDYALNLERWVSCIVARVFDQRVLEDLSHHARVPVINALSDDHHPCQALADMLTLQERLGDLRGRRLAYIGDANNVCRSLLEAGGKLGMILTLVCPEGHPLTPEALESCRAAAREGGGSVRIEHDPSRIGEQDAVYTDTWISMHHTNAPERLRAFAGFQVNADLMARAGVGSTRPWFMHCLPAHRGEEVTDEVIDSDRSLVYDQAENRMHAQNAVLLALLGHAAPGRAHQPEAMRKCEQSTQGEHRREQA